MFPLVLDGQEQPQFLVRPEAGVGVGIHIYIYIFFLMSIGLQRHCLHIVHVGFSIGHGGKCFLNLTHLWNIKTEKLFQIEIYHTRANFPECASFEKFAGSAFEETVKV